MTRFRWRAFGAAAMVGSLAAAPVAQERGLPEDLGAILIQAGKFTYEDLNALEQGRVVTRTDASPQDLEASVATGVRIATTRERAAAYFQQLISYIDGQVTVGYGVLNRPPQDADLARLAVDAADPDDLRASQADTCDVPVGP